MDLAAEPWKTRYEDLRATALCKPDGLVTAGWGQTLLMRRGVAAWMKAWPRPTIQATPSNAGDASDATPPGPEIDTPSVPFSLYSQVTALLVNIILSHPEEVCA